MSKATEMVLYRTCKRNKTVAYCKTDYFNFSGVLGKRNYKRLV